MKTALAGARRFPREVAEAGVHRPLLAVAAVALILFGAETALVAGRPLTAADLDLERAIQATGWGPLALTFGYFTFLGGVNQIIAAVVVLVAVFLANRPAAPLMAAGAVSAALYQLAGFLVHRPRPPARLVRVSEHLPCCSYPSGHTVFFLTFATLLCFCLGRRYLPRAAFLALFAIDALIVFDTGVARTYVGSHWPSDVAAGLLLGGGWTALVLASKRLSNPVFGLDRERPRPAFG